MTPIIDYENALESKAAYLSKKPVKSNNKLESEICKEFYKLYKKNFPNLDTHLMKSVSEIFGIKGQVNGLKQQGWIKGIPDYTFAYNGKYLMLEFKSATGSLSKEQKLFRDNHKDYYHIVRSANEGINLIKNFIN